VYLQIERSDSNIYFITLFIIVYSFLFVEFLKIYKIMSHLDFLKIRSEIHKIL